MPEASPEPIDHFPAFLERLPPSLDVEKLARETKAFQRPRGVRSGTDQWTGQLYNADDGKTYTGTLVLTGDNSLKVEGCVPGSQMCRAQTWMRAK